MKSFKLIAIVALVFSANVGFATAACKLNSESLIWL
jgi:hypothetical protein